MKTVDDEVQELVIYYGTLAGKHTAHKAFEEAAKTIVLERREARGQRTAREKAEAQVKELEAQIAAVKEVFAAEDKYAEHQEHCELCDNGSMPLCPVGSKLHEKWVSLRWKALKALESGEQDA